MSEPDDDDARLTSAAGLTRTAPEIERPADENAVPPAPGPAVLFGIAVWGTVTGVMTGIVTVSALELVFLRPFPTGGDIAGPIAFGGFSSIALVLVVRSWWGSLVSRAPSAGRWIGLAVPLFLVAGVAGGATIHASIRASVDDKAYRGVVVRRTCRAVLGADGEGPRVDACRLAARGCYDALLHQAAPDAHLLKTCVVQARANARPPWLQDP